MPEFFNVLPPTDALSNLIERLSPCGRVERRSTASSCGRILAEQICSPENLPSFNRSAMDGYSVTAKDTFGATEGLPAYLEIVGEVPMGETSKVTISLGQAAIAYTGGMLANNADAVVMMEHTQDLGSGLIEVTKPVAPGENVIQRGEDLSIGEPLLSKGHTIRPQDIGALLGLGITEITIHQKPRVSIVSTGDELVPPEIKPGHGEIRDINTYTISTLVKETGGIPIQIGLVGDCFTEQKDAALRGLHMGDALIFSAGSSVSARDLTSKVIECLGKPGVLMHGISVKPGKPTIVGLVNGKPVFGLPGNPVSAITVFDILVRPILHFLAGSLTNPLPSTVKAILDQDIPSGPGREDYVQVNLSEIEGRLFASPVFGKSNLINTMVRAGGVVKIALDQNGLYSGEEITVRLY